MGQVKIKSYLLVEVLVKEMASVVLSRSVAMSEMNETLACILENSVGEIY